MTCRSALLVLAFATCQPVFSQDASQPPSVPVPAAEVSDAIKKVYPALVRIYVVMEEGSDGTMKKMQGSGSGAIISPEGHVLTNHHVAGRGTRFVCTLSNHDEVDATLVGTDALSDLAILKLDLNTRRFKDQPLAVAGFGDSDALKTGDLVFAMGSPGGLSQSVTRGIVANTEMIVPRHQIGLTLDGEKVGELVRWIGHDAIIYPGNSGGPLVNPAGEIIGVNEVGIASLGGAIPSNLAKKVAAELIDKGSVTRSWIGVEVQPLLRSMADKKGALVASVWKGSPAANAGIQPGDFITAYQGTALPDCHAAEDLPIFNAMVLNTTPGTEVTLAGQRGGQPHTWKLTTVVREPTQAKEGELREWGLTTRDFTQVSALEKSRDDKDGVLVDTVRGGGPSSEAKPPLRGGDVIVKVGGKPMKNRAELIAFTTDFVKDVTEPKPLLVEFERDRQQFATVVKVGPVKDPVKPRLAEKAWMGLATQVITDELATALGIAGKKGVRVTSLAPDSPAKRAGLLEGDLLLKLDGKIINARRPEDSETFPELILAYPVDATVELTGMRAGQPQTWNVSLAPRPIDDSELREYKDELFEFTARQLSTAQRDKMKAELDLEPAGISVMKVEPSGWAALGGLSPDDVILTIDGTPMNEIDTLKTKLISLRDSKPRSVVFGIRRGPRTWFLEIEPRW
ncbi:PDZ domain-containing protein [Luteolibacter arcticus]|uniref:PDZ domain-containing protein n=1 Tax=Luteolibacter arcticus TaxID=1581411 RepID=A0ABT3GJX1_9BACT|nr:PDZ domain-containing protein [Luteolibacter arcticus]MCW1923791.1 PDZ domain-containing protein [Luteolibacter arcticus]